MSDDAIEPTGATHPVAELFPLLPDDELQDLAADIAANGLIHPLTLDAAGTLLDGRNRLAACRIAGVEPRYTTLNGVDPVSFILSANVARRHLSKGQRAMAVAKAMDFSSGKSQGKGAAARAAGVSGSHLSRAIAVVAHAPGLVEPVLGDRRSLNDAYAIVRGYVDGADAVASAQARLGDGTFTIPATMEEGGPALLV